MINLTPIARLIFKRRAAVVRKWSVATEEVQRAQLRRLLAEGSLTSFGREHRLSATDSYEEFASKVPVREYEAFRPYIMSMINGAPDVLWPGVTGRYAQSSGTSGGKSKYIPITDTSLRLNHYAGSRDVVAHYLNIYKDSRLFGGKALILGGSFANELTPPPGVKVGDLSASLIDAMPSVAARFRVPDKKIALMYDWKDKLPALIEASVREDITNLSGVPSWFLTVLKGVLEHTGASTIHEVWPNLEVFFHGGISFLPYREEYARITDPSKMRYIETYNASEGFFATQSSIDDTSMLLLLDIGIFYEFISVDRLGSPDPQPLPPWQVKPGETYALVITSCNGLWRYIIGDTVKVERVNPLKITIAGRTKNYINVFGEELMVHNAEAAIEKACKEHGCTVVDYTAGPVYATETSRGRHEWWIEWGTPPADTDAFARTLDRYLQDENSDYQAKRQGGIFLDCLTVNTAPPGLFDLWLGTTGKLGGQRKIPRLLNDRHLLDFLASNAPGNPDSPSSIVVGDVIPASRK